MSASAAAPVRAVLFDLGGVLTADPFAGMVSYAEELGIGAQVIADAVRDSDRFRAVETGASSMRDFLKWLCGDIEERHGARVDIRRLADCLASGQRIRPEMPALLTQVRDAGLRLALLTNNAREARSWWESGVLPLELFDTILDSSALGVRKPDPAVFRLALDRLGLAGREVVLVDDLQANIDGAVKAGLRGLRFVDPEQCRSELWSMLARSGAVATAAASSGLEPTGP